MSDDKPLLDQLRERRDTLLSEIAPAIDQREKERDEFAQREKNLVSEATKAIELITRDESKDSDEKRSAVKEADKPVEEARATFLAAEEGFEADFTRREKEVKNLTQRISEQEVIEFRKEIAAKASTTETHIGDEPLTYRRDLQDRNVSYFRDLAQRMLPSVAGQLGGDPNKAEERLTQHAKEMEVELPKRAQARERRAELQIDNAEKEFRGSTLGARRGGFDTSPFEYRVTPNRSDGQGGFFVGGDLIAA